MNQIDKMLVESWKEQIKVYNEALAESERRGSNVGVDYVRDERKRTLALIQAYKASQEFAEDL